VPGEGTINEDDVLGEADLHRLGEVRQAELDEVIIQVVLAEGVGRVSANDSGKQVDIGVGELPFEGCRIRLAHTELGECLWDIVLTVLEHRQEDLRVARRQRLWHLLDTAEVVHDHTA